MSDSSPQPSFQHMLPPTYKQLVQQWIEEDLPSFDIGGFVVGDKPEIATLYCKASNGYTTVVIAGIPFLDAVFSFFDLGVTWMVEDGMVVDTAVKPKTVVATLTGKCRNILMAERTALNIFSRASGVATKARRCQDIASEAGWSGSVAGTRKTTPGFRLVEKYALLVGGVASHRHDLSQMVMLKDNHVWSSGSITSAVQKAKRLAGFSTKIEVECRSLEEAVEACVANADIVMLDNFDHIGAENAAAEIKSQFPHVIIGTKFEIALFWLGISSFLTIYATLFSNHVFL